jgi:flagellar hook-associated protein 3 FlgL
MISGTRYQMRLEVNRQLQLAGEIARAQAEISSKKRILSPSDDPAAAARISDIARTQANQATWKLNLGRATALAAGADTALASTNSILDRAAELMLAVSNGTVSPENRQAVALELSSIADELGTLRDSRDSRGEPIFPDGEPPQFPVGTDLRISPVASRGAVFDGIATAAGPRDMVAIVSAAAEAVRTDDLAGIDVSRLEVDAALRHAISARSEQGARGARIDALAERIESVGIDLQEERSGLEDTDIIATVARLQSHELSLEAAQAVFARIHQSNLFDLLG